MIAWTAHLYTALGAVAGLLAALAVFEHEFRAAFIWLGVQVFIDSTDGALARAVRVKERIPWFDGSLLDNVIDYVTYVFVPALIVIRADLVPDGWDVAAGSAMLLASGYGFSRTDAKVSVGADYFFTGFPSYWNIIAFYLYVFQLPGAVNAAILFGLSLLVFVPVRCVYPSRTTTLRGLTTVLGCAWGAIMIWMLWRLPATDGPWPALSLVFPVYYTLLSFWLDWKSRH